MKNIDILRNIYITNKSEIPELLLSTALNEALLTKALETQELEGVVIAEMTKMNEKMVSLRSRLDVLFQSDGSPDLEAFAANEDEVRGQFYDIQSRLLTTSIWAPLRGAVCTDEIGEA